MTKFEQADAQVLGLSVDSMFALKTWAASMGGIKHPLLADFWPHGGVAGSFGIFNDAAGIANRALFIIDPQGVVRHSELHQGTLPQVEDTLANLAKAQG
ncbi:MAG: redoxin domain-containing protein [Gammaproteobacteria bacterium]|nr:redoxin domain-containing protein [Gammaproteobacteria bacterium]